jgi:TolB protein
MKHRRYLSVAALGLGALIISISCSEDQPTQPITPKHYRIAFTVSPDRDNDKSNIYTIDPDGTNLAQLTNVTSTRSADHPLWSPDGQYIYFKDFLDEANDIFRMDVDGSNQINLTNSAALDRLCDISPDGALLLVISETGQYQSDLFLIDVSSFADTNLTGGQYQMADVARFTPDGLKILVPVANGAVYDMLVLNIDGTLDRTMSNFGPELRRFEISPNGQKLVYETRLSGVGTSEVWICDIDGSDRTKVSQFGIHGLNPSWAPDSRKITFCEFESQSVSDIVIVNSDGSGHTILSDSTVSEWMPKWSPDGLAIAYVRYEDSVSNLYIMSTTGTGKTELTTNRRTGYVGEIFWSPGL